MRAGFPFLSSTSQSGCSCTTFDTTYLCDSHLPCPFSAVNGYHQSCTSMPCLWKTSTIFFMESPGKVSLRLCGRYVELVTPPAPCNVVGLTAGLGQAPSFFLQG